VLAELAGTRADRRGRPAGRKLSPPSSSPGPRKRRRRTGAGRIRRWKSAKGGSAGDRSARSGAGQLRTL